MARAALADAVPRVAWLDDQDRPDPLPSLVGEVEADLLVVGGGYIACEFASIFNGLGSTVTQLYRGEQVLRGFDDEVRHFVAGEMLKSGVDLRLNAGVSYNNVDVAGGDVDAWTYGVGAEYEIENTPFSVGAAYTRADVDSIDVDTWSLGLRYSFGGGLQARDRAGAGLNVSSITSVLGGL